MIWVLLFAVGVIGALWLVGAAHRNYGPLLAFGVLAVYSALGYFAYQLGHGAGS